jgi:hypothetical protein
MALLHDADLRPSKLELLSGWLPSQSWWTGGSPTSLARVGAFRFDDPLGEVGVETFLVRDGDGPVHQVPLTYRGEPFSAGEPWLVGTMEHSVLGHRWVYDGTGDPVYVATLLGTILSGGSHAQQYAEVDGRLEPQPSLAEVVGSGSVEIELDPLGDLAVETHDGVTVTTDGTRRVHVLRTPDGGDVPADAETLTGTWAGQAQPVVLAFVPSS